MGRAGGRPAALTLLLLRLLLLGWAARGAAASAARPAIIGGSDAKRGRFNYMTKLRMIYRKDNGKLGAALCGGAGPAPRVSAGRGQPSVDPAQGGLLGSAGKCPPATPGPSLGPRRRHPHSPGLGAHGSALVRRRADEQHGADGAPRSQPVWRSCSRRALTARLVACHLNRPQRHQLHFGRGLEGRHILLQACRERCRGR